MRAQENPQPLVATGPEVVAVEMPNRVNLGTIVVATDFSPASDRALNYALAIARRYDSHIYVVHAIRPDLYTLTPPEASVGMVELVHQAAEQEMAELLISGRLREVPHQVMIEEGDVWDVLSRMANLHNADLVVLGTHGRTGFEKMFLGSMAERVFRLSKVPVLTVGPGAPQTAPVEVEVKNIVYATDFSENSRRALPYALSLAEEHQASLTLLHVVENAQELSPATTQGLRESFTERLEGMLPPGSDLWCYPKSAVNFGVAVEQILQTCDSAKADLLVLGIRGGGVAMGHSPAARAYQIVSQATCPVLTVRG
ncbi:MAG TPA: universal stress protein [Patescibacteria group bacterium]|nr:universal stress protein [Patescibacteria group bacterium]